MRGTSKLVGGGLFALACAACGGRLGSTSSDGAGAPDASAGVVPSNDSGAETIGIDASSPTGVVQGTDASQLGPDASTPPELDASLPVFEAGPPPMIDASTPYSWLKEAMVGDWIGTRTDPWDPPATVTVHFDPTEWYSAHCVDPSCVGGVWHRGTDDDLPQKTYHLFDLHADGTGEAYIVIAWTSTDTQQGILDEIAVDPTATMMTFNFWFPSVGQYGPVQFTLVRQ
jgi:hypothetical protein